MEFGNEVSNVLNVMRKQKDAYTNFLSQETIEAGRRLVGVTQNLWEGVKKEIITLVKCEMPMESPYASIWWYSVLIGIKKDKDLFLEMICYIRRQRHALSANTNYFLFYQLKVVAFCYSELETVDVQAELWQYFEEIVEDFSKKITVSLDEIPVNNRNQSKVLILTEQFLGVNHGPTKTALDRCKCIIEEMGKQVLLINTTEVLSTIGEIPFFNVADANWVEDFRKENFMEWKGVQVPFYQCESPMPEKNQLNSLLTYIRKIAPGRVVAIGGSGMLANLVNKMIPVIVVGLCPSSLEYTVAKYQTLGRTLSETDKQLLRAVNNTEDNVIESIFTSSLKPQTEHISRKEMGIEDNAFVLVTVGMRLDEEISDEFLQMMNSSITGSMKWVLWGKFSEYENRLNRYPELKRNTIFAGTCKDILSRMEICDLYVNPTRKGGGTSCVEAMYKGLPVVTVNYGDVAVNAGIDFCVADYREMSRKIIRYYGDAEYYERMKENALRRVEILLDTEREFIKIIDEVDKRERSKDNEGDTNR